MWNEVKLPLKDNILCVEDNYQSSFNRLNKLKNKFDKKTNDLLGHYSNVINDQLKYGITETIGNPGTPGEVRFFLHSAAICEYHS